MGIVGLGLRVLSFRREQQILLRQPRRAGLAKRAQRLGKLMVGRADGWWGDAAGPGLLRSGCLSAEPR